VSRPFVVAAVISFVALGPVLRMVCLRWVVGRGPAVL